jgi:hypothetical protein
LIVPEAGRYLWDWYFSLSNRLRRTRDGGVEPIPPSEYLAWRDATAQIVYPSEYAILCALDEAYCSEMSKELEAYAARQNEKAKNPPKK